MKASSKYLLMAAANKEVNNMLISRRKQLTDEVIGNLLDAQKNMASAKTVDAKGLIRLSRFVLHCLKQFDDELIDLGTEAEDERC